ncbi:hypothetical protein TIFTF001_016582 [Ficus carica]|uniref:DDE Tnp4 domain-containing protein n=1 Tax=Ficus carica TaxID=3494 RepID=A0AA88ATG4_FICCA|nr:hypothetical protein TIFTF001_016582 [Ficus carica]
MTATTATATAGGGGGSKKPTTGKRTLRNNKPQLPTNNQHQHNDNGNGDGDLATLISTAISAAHSFLSRHDLHLLPSQSLSLESLLSSASLSLRKSLPSPRPPPPPPPPPPPLRHSLHQCWFRRFLSSSSSSSSGDSDPRWAHFFRMSEPSFTLLLRLLTPSLDSAVPPSSSSSSAAFPSTHVLAAALFRLAHGATYKSLARRFGFDSSADACHAFFTVCHSVNAKLGHLFELRSDSDRVRTDFGWLSLPNCCGVLGFGKFEIDGDILGENGSLLVQALVDSDGRFLDVSAGWPSNLKPETILHQTKLYLGVEETRDLLNGHCYELSDGRSIPQYVLGDSCFPLLPWLLTPYRKPKEDDEGRGFSSEQMAFNAVHSRAVGLVGTAFGRVRSRWRLLAREWKEECVEFLPFVVVTCCLLHNFVMKCSEPNVEEDSWGVRDGEEEEEKGFPVFEGEVSESGERIRDALAAHLSRVCLRR